MPPLETLLKAMHNTSPSDCPNYRFKEWTQHDRGYLEFTLPAIIPPLPPSIVFGKMDPEDGKTEMIRCITAHQLWGKTPCCFPSGRCLPTFPRLVAKNHLLDEATPVSPTMLLICLENLRTGVAFEDTLCFHLADNYRGKFFSHQRLQLLAIVLCRQAKVRFLDKQTYTREKPAMVLEALSIVHEWSCTIMGDQSLRRTVWHDRRAIFEHLTPQPADDFSNATAKWLIT